MLFNPSLRFVTSLIYSSSIAKMLNNLTFLYNPAWKYGQGSEPSLPVSFFFVKDCKEVSETQLNTKTVMFYNSQNTSDAKTKQGALLDVIADNSINMPRKYQLDILIPFQSSQYFSQFQLNPNSLSEVSSFMAKPEKDSLMASLDYTPMETGARTVEVINNSVSQVLSNAMSTTVELLKLLFNALSVDITSLNDWTSYVLNQNDINKYSIEHMRDARRILKMKWWNGWKFKYVMIEELEIGKKGTDEAFYEGRLTVTEVPVLTVLREDQLSLEKPYTTVGEALCTFLDKWFNKAEETA